MAIDWHRVKVVLRPGTPGAPLIGRIRWPADAPCCASTPHTFSEQDLWLVWAGRGTVTIRQTGQRIALRRGSCVWLRPGRTYDYWHDRRHRLSYYFAHFDLLGPDGQVLGSEQIDLPGDELHVPDHQLANSLLDYLVRCVRLQKSPDMLAEAAELFQFLLRQMDRATRTRNPQSPRIAPDQERAVSQALRHLDLHLFEPISVAELARTVGYSRGHFTELFRLVTGTSPGEYLIAARIAWAKQVLIQTKTPVSTIARQAGYREQPYFSRQFRERTGLSPTQFRAAHRSPGADRTDPMGAPS